MMRRGGTVVACFFCFLAFSLCAQVAAEEAAESRWVLGARPFELKGARSQNLEDLRDLSERLPVLLLESLADTGIRNLLPEEIVQRELVALRKARSSLVSSLNNAVAERDRQLFVSTGKAAFSKGVREKELEMEELLSQLEQNKEQIGRLKEMLESRNFDGVVPDQEQVALWQDTSDKLFDSEKVGEGTVNGLLTGSITVSGNYVAVTVDLTLYPGDIRSVQLHDAASFEDIVPLGQELAGQLRLALQNRGMVEVSFEVLPPEAAPDAVVLVDGKEFDLASLSGGKISLPTGSYSVVVESPGYQRRVFSGDFTESDRYLASVVLDKIEYRGVEFFSQEQPEGRVYVNGIYEGDMGQVLQVPSGIVLGTMLPVLPPPAPPSVDGEAAEGQEAVDGEPAVEDGVGQEAAKPLIGDPFYFTAEVEPGAELLQLNVRLRRESNEISARIEKRRGAMYNSYSALLVSLIPTLVSYGMYVNTHNAWAMGYGSESAARLWQNISTGSIVLTSGLGVNLAVQLWLFIAAADDTLPDKARAR